MAQRVYLLPIRMDFLQMFQEFLLTSGDRADVIWKRLEQRGSRQALLSHVSRNLSKGFDEAEVRRASRYSEFARSSRSRPYFIAGDDAGAAVASVRRLQSCAEREIEPFLRSQAETFGTLFHAERVPRGPDEVSPVAWKSLRESVEQAKACRQSFLDGRPVTRMVPKELNVGGLRVLEAGKTEEKAFESAAAAALFGTEASACLGRLAGLCEPSWWPGRNYWLGAIALAAPEEGKDLGVEFWLQMKARNPASLLTSVWIPGFEKGFDLRCPAYSTGLYFGYDAVLFFSKVFTETRKDWHDAGKRLTGYSDAELEDIEGVTMEALAWAELEQCGLLEGDELVGSLGYR